MTVVMMMRRMVTATVTRNLVRGPQKVLEITVLLFSPKSGPSTGSFL